MRILFGSMIVIHAGHNNFPSLIAIKWARDCGRDRDAVGISFISLASVRIYNGEDFGRHKRVDVHSKRAWLREREERKGWESISDCTILVCMSGGYTNKVGQLRELNFLNQGDSLILSPSSQSSFRLSFASVSLHFLLTLSLSHLAFCPWQKLFALFPALLITHSQSQSCPAAQAVL